MAPHGRVTGTVSSCEIIEPIFVALQVSSGVVKIPPFRIVILTKLWKLTKNARRIIESRAQKKAEDFGVTMVLRCVAELEMQTLHDIAMYIEA